MQPVYDDSDLTHLFELLRMLPGPRENPEFWTAVQQRSVGSSTELGYVFQKLAAIWRTLQEPTPENIGYLVRYLLFFFAGDDLVLWKLLNTVFGSELTMSRGGGGQWTFARQHGRYTSATASRLVSNGVRNGNIRRTGANGSPRQIPNPPISPMAGSMCSFRPVSC
jgi:hypothetical protein